MQDDTKGKVILSLLAGATAGIVAGLLLAPETGDETRSGLKKSASKLGEDLGRLLKDSLARLSFGQESGGIAPQQQTDRSAADRLLDSIAAPNKSVAKSEVGGFDDFDPDYDGIGGDARHSAGYGKGF